MWKYEMRLQKWNRSLNYLNFVPICSTKKYAFYKLEHVKVEACLILLYHHPEGIIRVHIGTD